jgi:hypothetical protein
LRKQKTRNNSTWGAGQTESSTPIEDLTLDICVLMSGSGTSDENTCKAYRSMSFDLMKRMISNDKYRLALDNRNKIETQYLEKLNSQTYGHHFVRQMASMGKTFIVSYTDINRGTRVKLEERGFTRNNEDYKFVVVATATHSKKLITHERHFFAVQGILSDIGIAVMLPNQA